MFFGSPFPSIGSPVTLKSRPSVPWPTGAVMGPPRSSTGMPRLSPSVVDIATARTQLLPRCCWISAMTAVPSSCFTRSAPKISGRCPSGNCTSSTGPMICTISPVAVFIATAIASPLRHRFGAGSDLEHFFRDPPLPRLVRLEREVLDEVARGVRGVPHRDEPCGVLGREVVEDGLIDRDLDQPRQHHPEDRGRIGLEDVLERRSAAGLLLGRHERKDAPHRRH